MKNIIHKSIPLVVIFYSTTTLADCTKDYKQAANSYFQDTIFASRSLGALAIASLAFSKFSSSRASVHVANILFSVTGLGSVFYTVYSLWWLRVSEATEQLLKDAKSGQGKQLTWFVDLYEEIYGVLLNQTERLEIERSVAEWIIDNYVNKKNCLEHENKVFIFTKWDIFSVFNGWNKFETPRIIESEMESELSTILNQRAGPLAVKEEI